MGSTRKIKQSHAQAKKMRGHMTNNRTKTIPIAKKILRRRGVARNPNSARFFFLKMPSINQAISLMAGTTVAKAMK